MKKIQTLIYTFPLLASSTGFPHQLTYDPKAKLKNFLKVGIEILLISK